MKKDTLFLLPPGFEANGQREFCPECVELWGLLAYYPFILDALEIVHVGIDHPRTAITDVLGDGRFNAPTLVLAEGVTLEAKSAAKEAQGRVYLDSARDIANLFADRHGIPVRRGG